MDVFSQQLHGSLSAVHYFPTKLFRHLSLRYRFHLNTWITSTWIGRIDLSWAHEQLVAAIVGLWSLVAYLNGSVCPDPVRMRTRHVKSDASIAPSTVAASWNAIGPGRRSCHCGRLHIGDMTREVTFLFNDYTNPNTNPKILTTLTLILSDPHGAFESFCASEFCDFERNYSSTVDGAVVTSY